ncbi:Tripeptidyl-peptidase sed3 [Psilocybe cubensis]|uniref:Tripeptidyl-peptidase sed3 n=1 Tax=Psilocybe cubensis TaxID=181762 RepID=A0ACB8H6Y7_PSICU|nr:Tripeptidyl-peptidase sed3 [Psilocybe cubensis]KAH9482944.1 Tripeptidyl-peptidase sed3 [Psilocybe cubensis]
MRVLLAFATNILFSTTFAFALHPAANAFRTKEEVLPPHGWVNQGKPSPDHFISLRIGLPQSNFPSLEMHLYEVSDPEHERYGQYLSKEEVEALITPPAESLQSVDEWLSGLGISEGDLTRSPAKDWIMVTLPVSRVEQMLDTTYYVWEHITSGDRLVRTTSYSLPAHIHGHIEVIQPTTLFGRFKAQRSTIFNIEEAPPKLFESTASEAATIITDKASNVVVDASCNTTITISCLQQLYNAVGYVPSGNPRNSIGITGYLEEFANIQDLQLFFADQRPDALNSSFSFFSVKGGLNNQTLSEAGAEANLDVQFAFGLSHPIPATFFSTAGRPPFIPDVKTPTNTNEPYGDWLDFVLSLKNPPLTISTSYGDDEQTVPESFARRTCEQFAQLGARGVSVLFSSGDSGVGDGVSNPNAPTKCLSNDGKNTTKFLPAFPASVTAVGGTAHIPEVAVARGTFFSGGGFSEYAYPDVSAQSDRYRIFLAGRPVLIGGTSASSPAFAGFVAMLNDARFKAGLGSLGFLNPLLYSFDGAGFNDITVGNNAGCGTTGFNSNFEQATKGWDPGKCTIYLFLKVVR